MIGAPSLSRGADGVEWRLRRVPLWVIYEGWVIVKAWSAPGWRQG
jgi:hypothetical protein